MDYNEHNRHPRDSRVEFDSGEHVYTVDACLRCDSVTTIVDACFEQFDAQYWAARKATAEVSAEELMRQWEEKGRRAREEGTLLHERIERHYLGLEPDSEALSDVAFRHFLAFAAARTLKPYRSEWRIFSEKYRVAGTPDFLAFDGCHFDIYDWKRSCKLIGEDGRPVTSDRYGKFGLGLMGAVPDTAYWHYALQVSVYRYLLESEYGIEVRCGRLGTFHPEYSRPYVIELPYMRDHVVALLESRLR